MIQKRQIADRRSQIADRRSQIADRATTSEKRRANMLNISYNISPRLNEYLQKIEDLRKKILFTAISPKREFKLKWEGTFSRIYYALKLSGNPLKKDEMLKVLSNITHKKTEKNQTDVIMYKKALDQISQEWLGSEKAVTAKDIIGLHRIIGDGKLRVPEAGLQHLLDYLQTKSENPIMQAGILNIEMEKMQLFYHRNKLISGLTALLFLYKYGYDFRGFLAYETERIEDSKNYKDNFERAQNSVSLTLWLEYFAGCILKQLESIVHSLAKSGAQNTGLRESFWELNERQKSILSYLDSPQATITNRQIQRKYKTSQITVSRDLAKLTNLGYLFFHGKGRSVFYTKI